MITNMLTWDLGVKMFVIILQIQSLSSFLYPFDCCLYSVLCMFNSDED